MLYLYYGRENVEKERFYFEKIKKQLNQCKPPRDRLFLLVPEQFTLQAERNAFEYLKAEGLMDMDILSQSRLGLKVLQEVGGKKGTPIGKYGRHMLLTKILKEERDHLVAFRGVCATHSFVDMANNLISEMKRFNTRPEDLPPVIEQSEDQPVLKQKLQDIFHIYTKYEEAIRGKYVDTEDYTELFTEKICKSQRLRNGEIWVVGFDYFPPKFQELLRQLLLTAKNLHIVMTGTRQPCTDKGIFQITENMIPLLHRMAEDLGIKCSQEEIGDSYRIKTGSQPGEKEPWLAAIEQLLYAYPFCASEQAPPKEVVTLCCAANYYAEAESAAAAILSRVREKGYRYRDIVVICNDMEIRASVIGRVFSDYGIPTFLDVKRSIMHNPVLSYIKALIDIVVKGWRYEDVFRLLKTGFAPITPAACSELENYVLQYRIRGGMWKKDFQYGGLELGQEKLAELCELRRCISAYVDGFESQWRKGITVRELLVSLYGFLKEEAGIPERLTDMIDQLNREEAYEYAEEMAQIWEVIMDIFDQLVELIGDEVMELSDVGELLSAGFESVEIGLLPPTADQVIVGTMQRTRVGENKALFVLGANDGVLPFGGGSEDLLNNDEKLKLLQKGVEICRLSDLRIQEEQLAIYRNFSRPKEYLWVSYTVADQEGRETKPSLLFERLKELFPSIEVVKDIVNAESFLDRVTTPRGTLRYLTEALTKVRKGESFQQEWNPVLDWYHEKGTGYREWNRVKEGLFFTNAQHRMDKELVLSLYRRRGGDDGENCLTLSPSALERYSRCPFSYLIQFGLRPKELRIFEIAGREIGDVYHEVIMRLGRELNRKGVSLCDGDSPWMSITEEQCRRRVALLVEEVAGSYREGVLRQGREEAYRADRMKEVCAQAAWALIQHVQQGAIGHVFFESRFGEDKGCEFPPIEVALGEDMVHIEGKIDRVDQLQDHYIKIIDYKSGHEKFDVTEARCGYKLQLMLYLKAAAWEKEAKPAGVFYFEIADPLIDASLLDRKQYEEKLKNEFTRSFKLDGILVDNPKVIEGIAGEFDGYSGILPVRKTKEGNYVGTSEGKLFSQEDFDKFQVAVDGMIEKICRELVGGESPIRPKKTKTESACKYCRYKGICNFDVSFSGCEYEVVR